MGFVFINGLLVPESSKPAARFVCRMPKCGARFDHPDKVARHVTNVHLRQDEQAVKELSLQAKMPEFFASDLEYEAWMQTPKGRTFWHRVTGDNTV